MLHEYYIENRKVSLQFYYSFVGFVRSSYVRGSMKSDKCFKVADNYQIENGKPICKHEFITCDWEQYFDVLFEFIKNENDKKMEDELGL